MPAGYRSGRTVLLVAIVVLGSLLLLGVALVAVTGYWDRAANTVEKAPEGVR